MSTPETTPAGLTIRDALTSAQQQGYDRQFIAGQDGVIYEAGSTTSVGAGEVDVDILWRIEGTSDSADELVVAAIVVPSGGRGTLLLTYGPTSSDDDNTVMKALDVRSAQAGLPPEER